MARSIALQNLDDSLKKFWVPASNKAPTVSSDLVVAEAGANSGFLVRGVAILNPGLQTAGGVNVLQLIRTTAAGVGGVITPNPVDPDDAAFSGICRTMGTQGTGGLVLAEIPIFVPTALAAFQPVLFDLAKALGSWLRVLKGAANGIALRHPGAAGAASFSAALLIQE